MDHISEPAIIVPERDSGKRLDAFLSALLKRESGDDAVSRVRVREAIEAGLASVNDVAERNPGKRLRRGDTVFFRRPETSTELRANPDIPLLVRFEDEEMLVIDKPAGIATHPVSFMETETVANWAISAVPWVRAIGDDPLRPGIVHRLDRNTSGILVIAKTASAFDGLKRIFSERLAEKRYLAIVLGHMPNDSDEIDFPIASRTGTLKRVAVMPGGAVPADARTASTRYAVKRRYVMHDLLEVVPKTGRTHQIRVHLAAVGHPVAGDRLYGGRRMKTQDAPRRQMLHAGRLSFPWHGEVRTFRSPAPDDFVRYLESLDGAEKAGYPGDTLD